MRTQVPVQSPASLRHRDHETGRRGPRGQIQKPLKQFNDLVLLNYLFPVHAPMGITFEMDGATGFLASTLNCCIGVVAQSVRACDS